MVRITIIAGVGFDRAGNEIVGELRTRALDAIDKFASDTFGGLTRVDSMGSWVAAGELIREPGIVLIVVADDDSQADNFALFVRNALNQQTVLLTVDAIATSRFI